MTRKLLALALGLLLSQVPAFAALNFTGASNSCVNIPGNGTILDLTTSNWAIGSLNFPSCTACKTIAKWDQGNQYLMCIGCGTASKLLGGASTTYNFTSLANISTSAWSALSFGRDASHGYGYLNGSGQTISVGNTPSANGHNVSLAASATCTSGGYTGQMAEVFFYKGLSTQLTMFEYSALSNKIPPLFVRRTLLVGYFPLLGIQSPEPDWSGNKNNGTVTNATTVFHAGSVTWDWNLDMSGQTY